MKRRLVRAGLCLVAAVAMAACVAPPTQSPDAASIRAAVTGTPAPAVVTSVATLAADALTPMQIFAAISPSVAFIDLPDSSGSGFLIDGGYLVTNAHVVWPYTSARVVFPDGSEHKDVPVVNWDLLADLAVLGPVETRLPPLALADGEGLPIGSDVYLIGYPGEVEKHPQPTVTRGVISRPA